MAGRSRTGRRQRSCLLESLEGRRLLAARYFADMYPEGEGPDFLEPAVEGRTMLFMNTGSLWRTEGYSTLELQPIAGRSLVPGDMAGTQWYLFFAGNLQGDANWELWRSNGNVDGTTLLKDIRPGPSGSNPVALTALGDSVLFVADDGTHGYELWRTDGTAEGTQLVKDIRPGPAAGAARPCDVTCTTPRLFRVGNEIYFGADAEGDGMDLWKTDGTAAGTVPVKGGVEPREVAALNGALIVRDADGSLWRSDGSEAGTTELAPAGGKQFVSLTSAGDSVFFVSRRDGELWRTDGTPAGTLRVKAINASEPLMAVQHLVALGDDVLFIGKDAVGPALWRSDGTEGGTTVLKRLAEMPVAGRWGGGVGLALEGRAYFSMTGDDKGQELWVTDGTAEGTVRVTDTMPGPTNSTPQVLGSLGWSPMFVTTDPERGRTLWWFEAPEAEARGPHEYHPWPAFYRAVSGYSVILNGQWSRQTDYGSEDVLKFEWDMDGDGVFGERGAADALRGDEVGMRPRFSAIGLAPGTYPVRLRVSDAMGVRDEDEVDVVVSLGEVKRVVGTDGPDRWRFAASEETFYVYDHEVSVNEPVHAWPIETVARVEFVGMGGDDYMTVSGETDVPVSFEGGDGYDHVGFGCDHYDFSGSWELLRGWDGYGVVIQESMELDHLELTGQGDLTLQEGAGITLRTRTVDIRSGDIDLNDNTLIIAPPAEKFEETLAEVEEAVKHGRWWYSVVGIKSYTAAGDRTDRSGVVVAVRDGEIIVKSSYKGDANADGRVNADDYFRIDSGFLAQRAAPRYGDGDFNFDGKVNADDYFLIDSSFLGQGEAGTATAVASSREAVSRNERRVIADDAAESRKRVRRVRGEGVFGDKAVRVLG